jgi:hypothetical protein
MDEDSCSHCYRTDTVYHAIIRIHAQPGLRPRSFCKGCGGKIAERWERRLRRCLSKWTALAYMHMHTESLPPLARSAS